MSPRDIKRNKTRMNRYGQAKINEWAGIAGKQSPTKFDTTKSQAANRVRWAKYYAAHPEALKKRIAKEKRKEELENERRAIENRINEQDPVV